MDYDLIPEGSEHVDAPPFMPEPDGPIIVPEGTEHVAAPSTTGGVDVPKKKHGGGPRPFVFTAKKQEKYLARIREGDGRDRAARNAGVSPTTVRAHRKRFPEFEAEIEVAESEANGLLERAAVQAALDGNATMLIFMLTNRMPEKYSDRRAPRVLQQINAAGQQVPTVEWDLQAARQETLSVLDELDERRRAKEAGPAIEATSEEQS